MPRGRWPRDDVGTLTLRRAEAADAAAVHALTRTAYAPWAALLGREPLPMTADYGHAVQAHRIDLAHDGDTLVGLIELVAEPAALLVENVAVRPDKQGSGIGSFLLRHAEAVAHASGLPTLRLYTNAAFTANIALYQRRGYAVVRHETLPFGTAVHMQKSLGCSRRMEWKYRARRPGMNREGRLE